MSPMRVVPQSQVLHSWDGTVPDAAVTYLRMVVAPTKTDADIRKWLDKVGRFAGTPTERNALMNELDDGLSEAFSRAVGDVAPDASVNAYRPLPFDVVVPPGRKGFPVPELQIAYRDWARRQRLIWYGTKAEDMPVNPATGRPYDLPEFVTRERFVDNCSHGRGRVLLDVLLGPNAGTRRARAKVCSPSSNWPGKNARWVRSQPGLAGRQDMIDLIRATRSPQGVADLRQVVREVLEDPMNRSLPGDMTDFTLLPRGDAEVEASVEFIVEYFCRHAPKDAAGAAQLDQFAEAQLTHMLGQTLQLHPRDLVHGILEARNIMSRSIEMLGEERGLLSIWDLEGIEGAIDLCVQNSRKEKGFLFELDLTSWLHDLLRSKKPKYAGRDLKRVIIEIKIDGLSGPDFGLVLQEANGTLRVRIAQAKCFEFYSSLTGFGGEYFGQFSKDIRRLWTHQKKLIDAGAVQGPHVWVQGGPPKIPVVEAGKTEHHAVDPGYDFYADKARMQQYAHIERQIEADEMPLPDGPGLPDPTANAITQTNQRIAYADAQLTAFTAEVTRYLQPGMPDSKAARNWILERSEQGIKNLEPRTARSVLEEHMDLKVPGGKQPVPQRLLDVVNMRRQVAGQAPSSVFDKALLTPITARELMAMRIALDPKSGAIDYNLVARLVGMDPPFTLNHAMHMPLITVT